MGKWSIKYNESKPGGDVIAQFEDGLSPFFIGNSNTTGTLVTGKIGQGYKLWVIESGPGAYIYKSINSLPMGYTVYFYGKGYVSAGFHDFVAGMVSKVTDMVNGLSTPDGNIHAWSFCNNNQPYIDWRLFKMEVVLPSNNPYFIVFAAMAGVGEEYANYVDHVAEYVDDDLVWVELNGKLDKNVMELNGHEEASFILPNTAANRAIVANDRDVKISFEDDDIYDGVLSCVDYLDEKLECVAYNDVYETMKRKALIGTYVATNAGTILSSICGAAGVAMGECPSTPLSVSFDNTICFDGGRFLARVLNKDYRSEGGAFNIGVRNSCVLCLPFEENAGTVTEDSSGFSNNGTIYGASWVDGKYGYGLSFNGTTDYVDCGNAASLFPNNAITVATWIKPNDVVNLQQIASSRGSDDANSGFEFQIFNGLQFYVYVNGVGWVGSGIASITGVVWNHVVGVFDGSTIAAYVNGMLGSSNSQGGVIKQSQEKLAIGRDGAKSSDYFNGIIDEVHIYNRALTASEIKFLYNTQVATISKYKVDRSKNRDKIIIKGSDSDGDAIYGEAGEGANVAVFREKKATDETTLNLLAETKLEELNTNTAAIKLGIPIHMSGHMRPGDTIFIDKPNYGLTGNHRIQKITKYVDRADVELARPTKTVDSILEELSKWEELGIAVIPEVTPSDNVRWSNDALRETNSTDYVKVKEIRLLDAISGSFRVKFTAIGAGEYPDLETSNFRIYKNGVAVGTEQELDVDDQGLPVTFSEDFNVFTLPDDLIQIYAKTTNDYGQGYTCKVYDMQLCWDPAIYFGFANQDP